MSKIREHAVYTEDALSLPEEGDLRPYVIFTQLKSSQPHKLAGYLDAADDEMAIILAKEHYGQDQQCVNLWAIPRNVVTGTEQEYAPSFEPGPARGWVIFTQVEAGEQYTTAGTVDAEHSGRALELAMQQIADSETMHNVWVVAEQDILSTVPGELIWRYSDQTYRLARGYSKDVREKWEAIRKQQDIVEYEKEDLHETF